MMSPTGGAGWETCMWRFLELLGHSAPRASAPSRPFWTEGQTVSFHGRDYRLVNRLGSGGVGTTFKVVEVDRVTKEDLGTYVAKVAHEGEIGTRVLRSYSLARSHLGRHAGLSTIFEVARQWQENGFVALMTWVDGSPLAEFIGVFPLARRGPAGNGDHGSRYPVASLRPARRLTCSTATV